MLYIAELANFVLDRIDIDALVPPLTLTEKTAPSIPFTYIGTEFPSIVALIIVAV